MPARMMRADKNLSSFSFAYKKRRREMTISEFVDGIRDFESHTPTKLLSALLLIINKARVSFITLINKTLAEKRSH
jgi:hypothetical protein